MSNEDNLRLVRLSDLDRIHTIALNDMVHIGRGDNDYHMLQGDYIDYIFDNLHADEPKWNAGEIKGVPVNLSNLNEKQFIKYDPSSNSLINSIVTYNDIDYGTLGTPQGNEYLKVINGTLYSARILSTDLKPSGINSAGRYLRVSPDGLSVVEDELKTNTAITTTVIENLNAISQSTIGRVSPLTLNRPTGLVGYSFVAKDENHNSSVNLTFDTSTGVIKYRVHDGNNNPNSHGPFYDVYNSRINPLSDAITSASATQIANSAAINNLKLYAEQFTNSSISTLDSSLRTAIQNSETVTRNMIASTNNSVTSLTATLTNEVSRIDGRVNQTNSNLSTTDSSLRSLISNNNTALQNQINVTNNTVNSNRNTMVSEIARVEGKVNSNTASINTHKTSGDHDGRYLRNSNGGGANTYYENGGRLYVYVGGQYRQIYPPLWS